MRASLRTALSCFAIAFSTAVPAWSQVGPDLNPAMNAPDKVAWQLYIQVNTRAGGPGNNALFETWASDKDTFTTTNPQFPTAPGPIALHPPIVPAIGREALQQAGGLLPAIPPNPRLGEESRRNKVAFDFIVQNNLYKMSGLRAAVGKTISFPVDSIEVKGVWLPVTDVPDFTLNRVSLADVPKVFHVNTGSDNLQYALVSMHVISKLVPNWTWATFENQLNQGRCDILGCKDNFGAVQSNVLPNQQANQGYPACAKTQALTAMINAASLDPAFANYCLKGSQTDFTDNAGLDVRVGNSMIEDGFVDRSSCMTCHGRAAWDSNGNATSNAGFDSNGAPLGPINPAWYWSFNANPPIFEDMPGLTRTGTSADFVWSIPFCALDDSVTPPKPKQRCLAK
jgi:hypothetical protein